MFRKVNFNEKDLQGVDLYEDFCLSEKLRNLKNEGGQIETGSPLTYTDRTDGVFPQHDIRTNKWDIAENTIQKAMDYKKRKTSKVEKEMAETLKTTEPEKTEDVNAGSIKTENKS